MAGRRNIARPNLKARIVQITKPIKFSAAKKQVLGQPSARKKILTTWTNQTERAKQQLKKNK